ncbi:Septum formation initiator [Chthonomonas calidirosea]|uniref:FtsB family cell division protein n=1 Tax=Chthonomonas calidirosea TaxID=454171 RepID=UPI0006DD3CCF|nr:septum formation initiator family protein [Chthonomonas calidirosea]CEK17573.1 Septum formation initiator [Chthonomonas calidirosea]
MPTRECVSSNLVQKNTSPQVKAGKLLPALMLLLFCVLCTWLGLMASAPYSSAKQWHEANEKLYQQLQTLRLQNQRRELELQALQTPAGIERAARELGYLRPNEYTLRLPSNSGAP